MTYRKAVLIASAPISLEIPPAGLAWLAGMCERHQLDYDLYDLNYLLLEEIGQEHWDTLFVAAIPKLDMQWPSDTDIAIDQALERLADRVVRENDADLFAVTVFSWVQITVAYRFLKFLRSRTKATIIVGGPGACYEYSPGKHVGRIYLEENLADYYVLGEGDFVLDRFLQGHHELGLNGRADRWDSWAPQIDDLNTCPVPSYAKIDMDHYTTINGKAVSITGSRGCVRRCTFCDIGHMWKKYRYKSSERLAQEIFTQWKQLGVKEIMFTDSLINGSIKQFREMLQYLRDYIQDNPEMQGMSFRSNYIIRDSRQQYEDIYQLMGETGKWNLAIGVESGSDAVRFHMQKKFTTEDTYHHLDMSSRYGIENTLLMMSGYPTETLEDHHQTMEFLRRCRKYLMDGTLIQMVLCKPYLITRNTPIDDLREELGIDLDDHDYGTAFWTPASNPELDVREKFRRFIELVRLQLELRIPGSNTDLNNLNRHIVHILERYRDKSAASQVK